MDQFPQAGQFFGVTHIGGTDGSYRSDVWECLASDDYRIVAKSITPRWNHNALTFYRTDWIIERVSDAVVAVLQVDAEQRLVQKAA